MKKFSKNYLYYHLVSDVLIVLVAAFTFMDALFLENADGEMIGWNLAVLPFFIAAMLLLYGVLILYRILYLRSASYMLTENEVQVFRGVFFRKKSVLDYSRMHAINRKQDIILRLFGLSVLTVDSGSANTSATAEILIYESTAEVDRLLLYLKEKKNGCTEGASVPLSVASGKEKPIFSSAKKLIYSLLNIASVAFGTLLVALFAFAIYFCLIPVLDTLVSGGTLRYLSGALTVALLAIVFISVLAFLFSVLQSFIGYYGFSVRKGEKDIEISYGLLTRHENTFGYSRIQSVVIAQGLIQRIFGYATLRLEVIGYHEGGNDKNEGSGIGILMPLIAVKEVEAFLSELLPSYVPIKKESAAKRYFPFVSFKSLFVTAGYAFVSFFVLFSMHLFGAPYSALYIVRTALLSAYLITELFLLAFGFLAYKNAGLSISDDRITVYGGGEQKRVTTLLRRSLVAIEDVTTPLRARAGIYTLILHIRTNSETNEVKVEMLNREDAERLLDILPD